MGVEGRWEGREEVVVLALGKVERDEEVMLEGVAEREEQVLVEEGGRGEALAGRRECGIAGEMSLLVVADAKRDEDAMAVVLVGVAEREEQVLVEEGGRGEALARRRERGIAGEMSLLVVADVKRDEEVLVEVSVGDEEVVAVGLVDEGECLPDLLFFFFL